MASRVGSSRAADLSASLTVPHERTAVRLARNAVSDHLTAADVGPDVREDVLLVLSELVSNAVQHAAPMPSGQIAVCWTLTPGLLHLEITDGGGTTRPQARDAALSSLGGRGLDIVRAVCSRWGVTEDADTVTVWAEVPRKRERPAGFGRPGN